MTMIIASIIILFTLGHAGHAIILLLPWKAHSVDLTEVFMNLLALLLHHIVATETQPSFEKPVLLKCINNARIHSLL